MSLIVGENGWNRFDRNEIFNWRGNSEWCGCVQNVVVGCVSMLSINKIFVFVAGGRALMCRSLLKAPHRQAGSNRIIVHNIQTLFSLSSTVLGSDESPLFVVPSHTHLLAEYRSSLHNIGFEILIQILRFSGRKQLANSHNETDSLTILTDLAGSRVGGRWIVTCRRGSIRAGRGLWDFVRLGPIRVPLTVLGTPRFYTSGIKILLLFVIKNCMDALFVKR